MPVFRPNEVEIERDFVLIVENEEMLEKTL